MFKRLSEEGFTLLEVVVSILIITTLVATFAPLIVSSVERIRWIGKRTQELYEIRSVMEKQVAVAKSKTDSFPLKGSTYNGEGYKKNVKGTVVLIEDELVDFVTFVAPKD